MADILAVSKIRRDGGTQVRAELNASHVETIRDAMAAGEQPPPVVVFYDGSDYWLADGFHRVAAAEASHTPNVSADVRRGTQRDAVLYAVGANREHLGLPRTNADKRRAVETMLADQEWVKWSDREIAKRAAVSNKFVSLMRATLATVNGTQSATRIGADGRTINTANIGKGKPAVAAPAPAPKMDAGKAEAASQPETDDFDMTSPVEPEVFDATAETPEHEDTSDADAPKRDFGELDDAEAGTRVVALCERFARELAAAMGDRPLYTYRTAGYRDGVGDALRRVIDAVNKQLKARPVLGVVGGS